MQKNYTDAASDVQVTVWCLAYNHEKYIRQTLEGFVSQKTNFKFEVLVHDDASTDQTAKIIREYEVKYPDIIKPIYQTENQYSQGIKPAERYLRPEAKGKYIAFCEGDDYWCDPEKLQKEYDIMEKYPDVILCVHKVACINEDGSPNPQVFPERACGLKGDTFFTQEQFADLLYFKSDYPFHTSSYFHRRELWQSDLNQKLCGVLNGDQRILRSALGSGSVYYIGKVMSKRRMQSIGNWTQRFDALSEEKKLEHVKKKMMGDILVDRCTERRYHRQITLALYNQLINMTDRFGKEKTEKVLKEVRKEYKLHEVHSLKLILKYLLIRISPTLFAGLFHLKKRTSKGGECDI